VSSSDLGGQRILIVGASAGIGRAVAEQALAAGAVAVLVGRRADRLDEVVAAAGGGHPVVADLSEPEDCARIAAEAAATLGTIDAVIVCSGTGGLARLEDTSQDAWRSVFDVNVIGPSLVVAAALPHLAPNAFLGFLSSESVGRPRTGLGSYSASKAALEECVRGWREEHPELRFCTVCVGATDGTEFARDFDLALAGELFPSWISHGHMALAMMQPADVASAIVSVVANALAHPGIDLQDVSVRPPGPLMTGAIDPLVDSLAENTTPRET
jgi:NAD(P)-dependent dehydrogenase (short-subunit alcohol dehydrogenase family)